MTEIVTPENGKAVTSHVALTDLISLKDTSFVLPPHAMRDLDMQHVINLAETDPATWPPIKVVETDEGLAVIDGYHRWGAMTRLLKLGALGLLEEATAKQNKGLETQPDEATQQTIEDALSKATVLAEIGVYRSEKDIAKAALTANLTHGLAPKGKARVQIALEYYLITRDEVPAPTQADIARMVGISPPTLNEYIKKWEKEQEKQAVSEGGEDETVTAEKPGKSGREKLLKKAEKLISDVQALASDDQEGYAEIMHFLFTPVLVGVIENYTDKDDKLYTDSLKRTLDKPDHILSQDMPHVQRFSKILNAASKRLEKPATKQVSAD